MKIFNIVIIWTIVLLTWCSICEAESWKKYFSNVAGYDFFYEEDTIVRTNKNEVLVWYKSCPSNKELWDRAWDEWFELREVDCTKRRYRVLQGRILYKGKMETLAESTWTYLEPGALYESFYNAVCGSLR